MVRDRTMLRIQLHWQNGSIHSFAHFHTQAFVSLHSSDTTGGSFSDSPDTITVEIYIRKLGTDTTKHLPGAQEGLHLLVDVVNNKNVSTRIFQCSRVIGKVNF